MIQLHNTKYCLRVWLSLGTEGSGDDIIFAVLFTSYNLLNKSFPIIHKKLVTYVWHLIKLNYQQLIKMQLIICRNKLMKWALISKILITRSLPSVLWRGQWCIRVGIKIFSTQIWFLKISKLKLKFNSLK